MLNHLYAPPLFPLAEQHAGALTTLGLAMFYMPVLPISPVIAFFGLLLSFSVNKGIALRRAAAPPNLSGMVTSSLNWLLRLLPLLQLILMKELYFRGDPNVDPIFYTGLAVWILLALAPIRALMGWVKRRRATTAAAGMPYDLLFGPKRLGFGAVYAPIVPKPCSMEFTKRVATQFSHLAPGVYESIINGGELIRAVGRKLDRSQTPELDLENGEGGQQGSIVRPGLDSSPCEVENPRAGHGGPHPTLRASFASLAAFLWQPHDPDHPGDEFVSPRGHPPHRSRSDRMVPEVPTPARAPSIIERGRSREQSDHESASDSWDPEALRSTYSRGGVSCRSTPRVRSRSAGVGFFDETPNRPVRPSSAGLPRGSVPATAPPALIPAVHVASRRGDNLGDDQFGPLGAGLRPIRLV